MGIFGIFSFIIMLIVLVAMAIPAILSFLYRHHINISRRREDKREKRKRRRKEGNVYVSKYPEQIQRLNTDGVGKYVDFEEIKDE